MCAYNVEREKGGQQKGESPSKLSNNKSSIDKYIQERNIKYLFLINSITIGMLVVGVHV